MTMGKIWDSHTICPDCWNDRNADRPFTDERRAQVLRDTIGAFAEPCCYCGEDTTIIIPVRDTKPAHCPMMLDEEH